MYEAELDKYRWENSHVGLFIEVFMGWHGYNERREEKKEKKKEKKYMPQNENNKAYTIHATAAPRDPLHSYAK